MHDKKIYHKNFSPFPAAETPWNTFYLASAENKMKVLVMKLKLSVDDPIMKLP